MYSICLVSQIIKFTPELLYDFIQGLDGLLIVVDRVSLTLKKGPQPVEEAPPSPSGAELGEHQERAEHHLFVADQAAASGLQSLSNAWFDAARREHPLHARAASPSSDELGTERVQREGSSRGAHDTTSAFSAPCGSFGPVDWTDAAPEP